MGPPPLTASGTADPPLRRLPACRVVVFGRSTCRKWAPCRAASCALAAPAVAACAWLYVPTKDLRAVHSLPAFVNVQPAALSISP